MTSLVSLLIKMGVETLAVAGMPSSAHACRQVFFFLLVQKYYAVYVPASGRALVAAGMRHSRRAPRMPPGRQMVVVQIKYPVSRRNRELGNQL